MFVTGNIPGGGGTETVLQEVLNSRLLDNNEVILYLFGGSENKKDWLSKISPKVKIYNDHNNILKKASLYVNYLKNFKPDIIISLNSKLVLITKSICKILNIKSKVISWIHLSLFSLKDIRPKCLRVADYNLAISKGIYNDLLKLGINSDKISLIFNPINRHSQRIPLTPSSEPLRLVYVGRIQYKGQKNIKELLQALKHLKYNDYILDVYGEGEDLPKCKMIARELNLNIKWHGWSDDPWKEIEQQGADYLVLTSNFEGFPMVILEALSRGLPVISSNCPSGPSEIIKSGGNGFLYPLNDIDALIKILKHEIYHRTLMNQSEIVESIDSFYKDKYIDNLINIIEHVKNY